MTNNMKKQFYAFGIMLLTLVLFQSCMGTTYLNVRHAAQISLPADLDSVLVINKTKVEKGKGKQVINVLEGLVTGEPILGDKYGSKSAVKNMQKLIRESDRMDLIHNDIINLELKDISGDTPIKSDIIDSICEEYGADGLIALELFDSDSYNSSNSAEVRTQWRVYYPNERKIIDEFIVFSGANDHSFSSFVPAAYSSISKAGAYGAELYFNRIVPCFIREVRYYYTKGSYEMKAAKKSVKLGNWDQAIYYWEVETESQTNQKNEGKAAYNLALGYEIKEDFDKALEWIDVSEAAGNIKATSYKAILRNRKSEMALIEEQLKRE
jgi:hypothetical protein